MDPDQALIELRAAIVKWEEAETNDAEHDAAQQATSAAGALDDWLTHGGFLPAAWQARQPLRTAQDFLERAEELSRNMQFCLKKARELWRRESS